MLEFLIYDLKAAGLIAIFYMFYRLLLAKETLHSLNRIVLLATALLSFVLPLCVFTIHREVAVQPAADIQIGGLQMEVLGEGDGSHWWLWALSALFIAGAAITILRSLYAVIQVVRLIKKSEKHPQDDGTVIVVSDRIDSPFSWMHYIVMSRSDYASQDAAILAHERGHIHRHHSWDVLFTDIVTPLQWFNPAIWMLRSDLRSIHEYEADQEALSQGINARQYQLLLVTKSLSTVRYCVANGISHSTLKKRITMMLKKQSCAMRGIKVLFALPIIAVSLALNAKTETTYLMVDDSDVPSVNQTNGTAVVQQEAISENDGDYLYIVDGKQMTDISGIPSGDIESMTVLKGEKARLLGYPRDVVIVKLKKNAEERADVSAADDGNLVLDVCEQMPEFAGGVSGMMNYLLENIRYPQEAFEAGAQGRVLVKFIVNQTGEVSDASILQGVEEHLDKEALRVISTMPAWKPGMQDGKPVKVRFTIPVTFLLSGNDTPEEASDDIKAVVLQVEDDEMLKEKDTNPDIQTMETMVK